MLILLLNNQMKDNSFYYIFEIIVDFGKFMEKSKENF
jgi:hypothetical protein